MNSILIAQLPDGSWVRDNSGEIQDPATVAAILSATIAGQVPVDPDWDGIPYEAEASAPLTFGSAGVGAVCFCAAEEREQESEPYRTIAEALDVLRPGHYPVYGPDGQVIDWFSRSAMSVAEAAELLDLSDTHVRALCRAGKIKATKEGGRWLPDETSVMAYRDAPRRAITSTHPRAAYFRAYQRRRRTSKKG